MWELTSILETAYTKTAFNTICIRTPYRNLTILNAKIEFKFISLIIFIILKIKTENCSECVN